MILFGSITIFLNSKYLGYLKTNLDNIKYSMFLSYYNHISIYYIRELTLLNFYIGEIDCDQYLNYTTKDREEYNSLILEQLFDLFIKNEFAMKIIYSSSLPLNKNIENIISKSELIIKMTSKRKINMSYDILTALMQYSSAFYNLALAPSIIEENYTDVYCFIYNNLNGYKKGINIFIDSLRKQLLVFNEEIIIIFIIFFIFLIICFIILYILIILNFLKSLRSRANYMKVFYGINEDILKKSISHCEMLLKKVRTFDEENNNEEESSYENLEEDITNEKYQKITKKENSLKENFSLNESSNENWKQKIISFFGMSFIISYLVFILICLFYVAINGFTIIKESKNAIIKSDICKNILDIQITIIDAFNAYREFLFDNQSIIDNLTPSEYLDKMEKEEFSKFVEKMRYITASSNLISNNNILNLTQEKNLCNYYINDYFDSSAQCEEEIGLISKYNFNTLAIYFIEEIKIKKNLVKLKLLNENVLGNLTEYNYTDYINNRMIPKKGDPFNYSNIFRLNLFNNYTIHYQLNLIFFNVILPYIEKNREEYFSILTFEFKEKKLLSLNILILVIISLLFFCFFIPVINYINSIIYKAKNMLSIIPLNILSYQSDALTVLNIPNNK